MTEYGLVCRKPDGQPLPESVRAGFLTALRSGLSPTAAATVVGVSHTAGLKWARAAGHRTDKSHYGIRYPRSVREAMRSGSSVIEAAVIAGVSQPAAVRWVQQAAYVPRTQAPADDPEIDPATRDRSPLTFTDRCRLEELLEPAHLGAAPAGPAATAKTDNPANPAETGRAAGRSPRSPGPG